VENCEKSANQPPKRSREESRGGKRVKLGTRRTEIIPGNLVGRGKKGRGEGAVQGNFRSYAQM